MNYQASIFTVLTAVFCSCEQQPLPGPATAEDLYFPPFGSEIWETTSSQLTEETVENLEKMLSENGTRAFILLKDGKIALEFYSGNRLASNLPFEQRSLWYWASAGKTLTATLVGLAQEEGHLSLNQPTAEILGSGWSSLPVEKENQIQVRHHLNMTTGLDDGVSNPDDYQPESLRYLADPGKRWAYHNAPYTLLDTILSRATGSDLPDYFQQKIASKTGMSGFWQKIGFNQVFFSDARSMARFGLMVLAGGRWEQEEIIRDTDYFSAMLSTSQDYNQSYGYLWWLNGKESFMLPGTQTVFPGSFLPNGPSDMVCAMGRDGQFLCVVPSENLVLVRLGDNPDQSPVPFLFLNNIWEILGNRRPLD
jgi:CubicO group peptidase (beta-lactamase class C family)